MANWLIFQLEGARCCDNADPSPLQHYPNSSPVPLSSRDSGMLRMMSTKKDCHQTNIEREDTHADPYCSGVLRVAVAFR